MRFSEWLERRRVDRREAELAVDLVVRRHAERITYGRDQVDASPEDIAQEALHKILALDEAQWLAVDRSSSFESWCGGVVRNVAADLRRRSARRPRTMSLDHLRAAGASPSPWDDETSEDAESGAFDASDEETRRRGDEETRRRGDEETRRRGDEETNPADVAARFEAIRPTPAQREAFDLFVVRGLRLREAARAASVDRRSMQERLAGIARAMQGSRSDRNWARRAAEALRNAGRPGCAVAFEMHADGASNRAISSATGLAVGSVAVKLSRGRTGGILGAGGQRRISPSDRETDAPGSRES